MKRKRAGTKQGGDYDMILIYLTLVFWHDYTSYLLPVVLAEHVIFSSPAAEAASAHERASAVIKIAFGSCNRATRTWDPWPAVQAWAPDQWLWTGDAVYHDSSREVVMRQYFQRLRDKPAYQQFAASVPIDGSWDDHDYGKNDAGAELTSKALAQQVWLDFLGVAEDSPRREQAGVYHTFDLGNSPRQVVSSSTPLSSPTPRTKYGYPWRTAMELEQQLTDSPAQMHLLISSIQVLPQEHRFECWQRF